MVSLHRLFHALRRARAGATAIEYGLIAALIAVSAIAAMQGVGGRLITNFMAIADALGLSVGGGSGGPPGP